MKSLAPICFAVAVAIGEVQAGPEPRVILAAMTLTENTSYAWVRTVDNDAGAFLVEGKTDGRGYTWVRLPMPAALSVHFARDADPSMEAFFCGTTRGALQAGGAWFSLAELPALVEARASAPRLPPTRGSPNGSIGVKAIPLNPQRTIPREGARFYLARPHEELALIVAGMEDMQLDGNCAHGRLSPATALLLLSSDDGADFVVESAQGQFKLWLGGGGILKYHLVLEAAQRVGRRVVTIHASSTTVLKDVGRTVLTMPAEVLAKLER